LDRPRKDPKITKDRESPESGEEYAAPSYEAAPLARTEYITAAVHFYRGELDRATQWRLRLDTTTNWAIFSVMGLITFSLGEPSHSHVGILAGMVLVFTFLGIEARRFRFFDVWRARVRMLEENFFGPIFRRELKSPVERWGFLVAEDLLHPRFKITYHQALRARLLRNYGVLFTLLLVSWLLKLVMHHEAMEGSFFYRMQLGPIAWWVSLMFVLGLYFYLVAIIILVPSPASPEEEYWGVDEVNERVSRIDI
jgi:uncharacterized membrane protein